MKQVFKETIGNATVVIVQVGSGYRGTIWRAGDQSAPVEHEDLHLLKSQLCNEAGKLHPDYYGIDGARKRFLKFFPRGFEDDYYFSQERNYKDKARKTLFAAAPLEEALDADGAMAAACRKVVGTNLLSPFESARLSEILLSADGAPFIRAAAAFTKNPSQTSLGAMERLIAPHGNPSWPQVTYFPFFWAPERHMFLKPVATVDFATRIGDALARVYDSALQMDVYNALLALASGTEKAIADLKPKDRIDVQSFIWVVGSYTDAELRK